VRKRTLQVLGIILAITMLLSSGCGKQIELNDEKFLENYEYFIDYIWMAQDGAEIVYLMFLPMEADSENVLWGQLLLESTGAETASTIYEITEVIEYDKFVLTAYGDWIITVNPKNGTMVTELEDGSEIEWEVCISKSDMLSDEKNIVNEKDNTFVKEPISSGDDKAFGGEINIRENYKNLLNNLWAIDGSLASTIKFIPLDMETKGIMASVSYSYEILEELSNDELLLISREFASDSVGKIILDVDRDNDKMYLKNNATLLSYDLCTKDADDVSLSTYEYVLDNLWYWHEEGATLYIQPIENTVSEKTCGIIGEIMFTYEIISANAEEIVIDLTDTSSEYAGTLSLKLQEDSELIYAEELISGETMVLEKNEMPKVLNFVAAEDNYLQQDDDGNVVFIDEECQEQYNYITNAIWTDDKYEIKLIDKGLASNNQVYGEYIINDEVKGIYYIKEIDVDDISTNAIKINYHIDWIENGEMHKGYIGLFKNENSSTLEWRERVDGTYIDVGYYVDESF